METISDLNIAHVETSVGVAIHLFHRGPPISFDGDDQFMFPVWM
jgi:hypothetical protein